MQLLFRVPDDTLLLALLGMLGGSPAGARLIALRYAQGRLTRIEAQRMAALCATCSPMFILATIALWLGSATLAAVILLCHWLGGFLTGLLFARVYCETPNERTGRPENGAIPPHSPRHAAHLHTATTNAVPGHNMPDLPPDTSLPAAIREAAMAMLSVCGCIVLFMVASALVQALIPTLSPLVQATLACVLEMAGGCARIAVLSLPPAIAAPLYCAAVSFAGLSIFTQNAVFLRPIGVRMQGFLAARCVHALLAMVLCMAATRIPALAPAFAEVPIGHVAASTGAAWHGLIAPAMVCVPLCALAVRGIAALRAAR